MKRIFFLLVLLATTALHAAVVPVSPAPPSSTIYNGGAAPANTQVVVSNGTSLKGDSSFTEDGLGNLTTNTITSSVATGTAPLTVTSTTQVPNLNASQLIGSTWAIPGAIGSTTPNTGAFSTLSATGVVAITNGTASTTAATGAEVITGGLGVGGAINSTGAITSASGVTAGAASNIAGGTLVVNSATNGAWLGFIQPVISKTSGSGSYPFNNATGMFLQVGNSTSTVGGGFYFGVGNGATSVNLVAGFGGPNPAAGNMTTPQFWGRNNAGTDTAGAVGETITGTATTAALAATGTPGNLTSVSLTAGKWQLSAWCVFDQGTTGFTAGSVVELSISATTGANGTEGTTMIQDTIQALQASGKKAMSLPSVIVNISATTSYFMVGQATYAAGSPTASGLLTAVRLP